MIHSFLLIGQSNMAGRGVIEEAIPVDNTHIKVLRNGRWQKMFRPVNPDRSFSGVSLAESFKSLCPSIWRGIEGDRAEVPGLSARVGYRLKLDAVPRGSLCLGKEIIAGLYHSERIVTAGHIYAFKIIP